MLILLILYGTVHLCRTCYDYGYRFFAEKQMVPDTQDVESLSLIHIYKNFTFKVDARRARKNYPMTSMEINAAVGEKILEAFPETSVDVHLSLIHI